MKELEALEVIKNAPTIYVGCGSDIYTRYPIECKKIEKALKVLQIIKDRLLIDEDMGIIETKEEPTFGKVAHLHSITFQILSDEENYNLVKEVLK